MTDIIEEYFDKIEYRLEKKRIEKPTVDARYVRPVEATKKIRMAGNVNQTVWIKSVCGYGKTSFIADYLKNRKYDYYSAQEQSPYQVEMPEPNEKKRSIVVIDDFYGILEEELQEAWYEIIEKLVKREDIWLIILSRCALQSWINPLAIKYVFYQITEKDLEWQKSQIEEYFEKWGLELSDTVKEKVYETTRKKGHPLCLKIMALTMTEEGVGDIAAVIKISMERFWQYLNSHVYEKWNSEIRDAMIRLCLLEEFDMEMAINMTSNRRINIILKNATEMGDFLSYSDGIWTIEKAMRNSLIQRLQQNYDIDYIKDIYTKAGDCFRMAGNIPKALELYETVNNKVRIYEALVDHARENMASGHYYELKNYYLKLTEEEIEGSVELMMAVSILNSVLMNEEASEYWYKKLEKFAQTHSGEPKKEAKMRLIYLDIALPHRGSINLINILKNTGTLIVNHKLFLPEFSVTSNLPSMMNGGKDFCEWSKKDDELARTIGKPICLVLGKYGKGFINLALAESYLEKGSDFYEVELKAVRGKMEAEAGGKIEQSFVGAGLLAWVSILTDHMANAESILEGFEELAKSQEANNQLFNNLEALRCRMALYKGNSSIVNDWTSEAPDENDDFFIMDRFRYLTKVRVYLGNNRYSDASMLLAKLDYYASKLKRTYIEIECKILSAILRYRQNDSSYEAVLQDAISQAESYHFVRIISREGVAILPLLKKAKLEWKDQDFKKKVEAETSKVAEYYPEYLKGVTDTALPVLSENAKRILLLQSMGMSNEKIAKEIGTSVANVKYHNSETYKKLGVKSKAQAVTAARNLKII